MARIEKDSALIGVGSEVKEARNETGTGPEKQDLDLVADPEEREAVGQDLTVPALRRRQARHRVLDQDLDPGVESESAQGEEDAGGLSEYFSTILY